MKKRKLFLFIIVPRSEQLFPEQKHQGTLIHAHSYRLFIRYCTVRLLQLIIMCRIFQFLLSIERSMKRQTKREFSFGIPEILPRKTPYVGFIIHGMQPPSYFLRGIAGIAGNLSFGTSLLFFRFSASSFVR